MRSGKRWEGVAVGKNGVRELRVVALATATRLLLVRCGADADRVGDHVVHYLARWCGLGRRRLVRIHVQL
jgi:hypothetical protein